MTDLKEGMKAPDFKLKDTYGKEVKLTNFKGRKVILYFYPKDNTTGCTIEACSFRDAYKLFTDKHAVILGVSLDNESSHLKFTKKHDLPFQLLVDDKAVVSKTYGAYGEKSFLGKKYLGIKRTTFIIGETGKIIKIFHKVKPLGHAKEILNLL